MKIGMFTLSEFHQNLHSPVSKLTLIFRKETNG